MQAIQDAYSINDALMKLVWHVENACSHAKTEDVRNATMADYAPLFHALGTQIKPMGRKLRISYDSPIGYAISTVETSGDGSATGQFGDFIIAFENRRELLESAWRHSMLDMREGERITKDILAHAKHHRMAIESRQVQPALGKAEEKVFVRTVMGFSPMMAKALHAVQSNAMRDHWMHSRNHDIFWATKLERLERDAITSDMLLSSFSHMINVTGMGIAEQIEQLVLQNRSIRLFGNGHRIDVHSGKTDIGLQCVITNFYGNRSKQNETVSDDDMPLNVEMPEAVLNAAAGRPLEEVVSHPITNGMDIRIESVQGNRLNLEWEPVEIDITVGERTEDDEGRMLLLRAMPPEVKPRS